MRWPIDLEYDGAGFVGWQLQPNGPSIQGALEEAIAVVFGEHVRVGASGRTDAGVHAEQQVASFTAAAIRSPRSVRDGLNAHLPPGIAVIHAAEVPDDFDPRRDAKRKSYRYTWLDRPARSALVHGRVWHVRSALDVDRMHDAAQHLIGTHDFRAFRASYCEAATTVRTIHDARVERERSLVHFRIEGNGFLAHMVRILAGSLWEVGRGNRPAEWLQQALVAGERSGAGRTAPPEGLTLEWVRYQ